MYISVSCGGETKTTCGKCKVIIKSSFVEAKDIGKLSQEEVEKGYY